MRLLILWLCLATSLTAHVVSQISGVWQPAATWEIEITYDAGYAVPEWRGDADVPPPTREWLLAQGPAGWGKLRHEAERYLRESLTVRSGGAPTGWRVTFPDFAVEPPAFPELLTGGAYFRVVLTGDAPLAPDATLHWAAGERPDFVLRVPDGYRTLEPGSAADLPVRHAVAARPAWREALRQGFLHVLPRGYDHILFVLGLFFYQRTWRALLGQSLVFTLAHTVSLGLAAGGWVRVPGGWVEPLIALSITAVALGNLSKTNRPVRGGRWPVVFAFGLLHGLGFAGTLAVWIPPGGGFLPALLCANLGVETAQAAVLGAAWLLTAPLWRSPVYPKVRLAACLALAAAGAVWFVERLA